MALIINGGEILFGNYIPPNGLLEARDMEDIVDLASLRKLQLICYLIDTLDHPVWPIEMWFEIFNSLLLECGLFLRLKMHIEKIPHLKLSLYLIIVCIHLLLVMGVAMLSLSALSMS